MDDITLPEGAAVLGKFGTLCQFDAGPGVKKGGTVYTADQVRAIVAADRAKGGEAVATVRVHKTGGNAGLVWSAVPVEDAPLLPDGTKLYIRPAPTQDAEQAAIPSAQPALDEDLREHFEALDLENHALRQQVASLTREATTWNQALAAECARMEKLRRPHPRLRVEYWTGVYWEPLHGVALDQCLNALPAAPQWEVPLAAAPAVKEPS